VAEREEYGVPETVVAEKVFVQQQHSDVGGVPEAYEPHCEHLSRHWNLHCRVNVVAATFCFWFCSYGECEKRGF